MQEEKLIKRTRASVVCRYQDKVLGFRAVDPFSGQSYVFLPGGKIEEEEASSSCAERETFEETGYRVRVHPETLILKQYVFRWDGIDYLSETYFYAATLIGDISRPAEVHDQDYNKGVVWVPTEEISKIFAYHPDILFAVDSLLKTSLILGFHQR